MGDEVSTVKIFSLNLFRVEDMATRDLHNNVAISLGRNSILINNEIRYSLLFIPHILNNRVFSLMFQITSFKTPENLIKTRA